jgi:HTH-type transcriptional regulator/antitoxin HipB
LRPRDGWTATLRACSVSALGCRSLVVSRDGNNRSGCSLCRMACPAGIEPATTDLEGRCSIQLSYGQLRCDYAAQLPPNRPVSDVAIAIRRARASGQLSEGSSREKAWFANASFASTASQCTVAACWDNAAMAQGKRISVDISDDALMAIKNIGVAAKEGRIRSGEAQAVAAARLGVHVQTIARIESGQPGVAIGHALGMLALYGMSIEVNRPAS